LSWNIQDIVVSQLIIDEMSEISKMGQYLLYFSNLLSQNILLHSGYLSNLVEMLELRVATLKCQIIQTGRKLGGTDFGRTEFGRIPFGNKLDFGRTRLW
jgi:hypothetical protein